jgi:predicted AlkP superfamily phosphohydrolase/phosphomutase
MLSTVKRRVAVLGWWASWPAEPIHGIVVSDRATRSLENAFWPPEFSDIFEEIVTRDKQSQTVSSHSSIARQDRASAAVAIDLASQRFDLLLVYLRNVDAESHPHWKYFRPDEFEQVDPERLEKLGQRVPEAYAAVDRILGELRTAADPRTNFFVVSDHGFRAVKREQYRINLNLDRVLEHLGYLRQDQGGIDWQETQAATWGSSVGVRTKLVRFGLSNREPGGPIDSEDLSELRDRLTSDLAQVTYRTGEPAFRIREPKRDEKDRGADLTVVVRQIRVSAGLEFRGQAIPRAIAGVHEITGSHDANTEGIFLAAGPDIDAGSPIESIHSLDITPTLLYALSLPVAQDFDGRPQAELFRREFRRRNPVQTIPSWGTREPGEALSSQADTELLEELRALGYLD